MPALQDLRRVLRNFWCRKLNLNRTSEDKSYLCDSIQNQGHLTVCSICADAYHSGCHQPRILEKVKSGIKWLCINCQMPEELAVNDIQSNLKLAQHSNGKLCVCNQIYGFDHSRAFMKMSRDLSVIFFCGNVVLFFIEMPRILGTIWYSAFEY